MKPRKIYLAGKVTGMKYEEAYKNFYYQEMKFRSLGLTVNPMRVCKANWSWLKCMIVCIVYLITKCNRIALQDNWKQSKGAKFEVIIAILTRKEFV